MATWQTYQKKATVVGAMTADTAADYGVLGTLVTTDYIIKTASGALHTLSSGDFNSKYDQVSSNTALTGTDWD